MIKPHCWFMVLAAGLALPIAGRAQSTQPADASRHVILDGDVPWVISPDEPEALRLALLDVQEDWYKVLGRPPIVFDKPPANWSGPLLMFGLEADWLDTYRPPPPQGRECLTIVPVKGKPGPTWAISGTDVRGAIYAAYAFSEQILGVDPWCFWTDHEPPYLGQVTLPADFTLIEGPPLFEYRGWFINDEDLLSGWARDPMGACIINAATWDRIYETLLRLRGNMVVPGTFTFPDEVSRKLAARRGLIINDHHVNVVGLNTFQWPDDVPYNFRTHPEVLEAAWSACIDYQKDWEMLWTVGFRGKHDRPFWVEDKEAKTPEIQGRIISDAIARQVELIRAAQPEADIIMNFWGEGVDLFYKGFLKIPEGVIRVWPDDGHGCIRDRGKVQAGEGVYYHTAMLNGRANQLTELVPVRQICKELGRFTRAGATKFFLLNVSDIRLVPLTTDAAMRFVWQPGEMLDLPPAEVERRFRRDWVRRQYGVEGEAVERIATVHDLYFQLPYIRDHLLGEHEVISSFASLLYHLLSLAMTGETRDTAKFEADMHKARRLVDTSMKPASELLEQARGAKAFVPADRAGFYQMHVMTQVITHVEVLTAVSETIDAIEARLAGDSAAAARHAGAAVRAYDRILEAQRAAEYGRWRGFFMAEACTHFHYLRDGARRAASMLAGGPDIPRHPHPTYKTMYEYQEASGGNFPFFHPSSRALRFATRRFATSRPADGGAE